MMHPTDTSRPKTHEFAKPPIQSTHYWREIRFDNVPSLEA